MSGKHPGVVLPALLAAGPALLELSDTLLARDVMERFRVSRRLALYAIARARHARRRAQEAGLCVG